MKKKLIRDDGACVVEQTWTDKCGYGINDPWDEIYCEKKSGRKGRCEFRDCRKMGFEGVVGFICSSHANYGSWVDSGAIEEGRKRWRNIKFDDWPYE